MRRSVWPQLGAYLIIVPSCGFFVFPVFWLFFTALRPPSDVFYAYRGTQLSLENLRAALAWPSLGESFVNSAIVATASTIVSLVITLPSGYMLARFPGKVASIWFLLIYVVRAVPFVSWLLPLYLVIQFYGLYDTYTGIVLAQAAFHIAFFSWVMKGFFEGIPLEIEEAAFLDGCSRWRTFIRITLPCALPGIAALSVLSWLWSWNDLLFAMILTGNKVPMFTVTLGQFINEMGVEWGTMAAAATLAVLPSLLFTLAAQRYIVRGLSGLGG